MFAKLCILFICTLISCAVGIPNVNYSNKDETESNFQNLERNINQTLYKLESKMLEKLLKYIDNKTETLNNKIPKAFNASKNEIEENLEEKITQILIASNKIIEENLEEKIKNTLNASNKKMEDSFDEKIRKALNVSNKNIEGNLEEKIKQTLNALDSMKKELIENNRIISTQFPCKEVVLRRNRRTQYYSMDDVSLSHVKLKRNATGHRTYFKMHVLIEAGGYVAIALSEKENYSDSAIRCDIDIGQENNEYTALDIHSYGTRIAVDVVRVRTTGIMSSSNQFQGYIELDGGKLQFGKEGESPLISYNDDRFSEINYFRFYRGGDGTDNDAKIRYNCPPPVMTFPDYSSW